MKFVNFRENYDGAPISLEEFAFGAEQVDDNKRLSNAAKRYIEAQDEFELMLDEVGIEVG